MLKHFGFVVLLTLGISVLAQGGGAEDGQTKSVGQTKPVGQNNLSEVTGEVRITVNFSQLCCENNKVCEVKTNGTICKGKFTVILEFETSPSSTSAASNGSEAKSGGIVISVNDPGPLMRSLDKIIAEQYDSNAIKVTKQPREIFVEKEHQINPVRYPVYPEQPLIEVTVLRNEKIRMPYYFRAAPIEPVTPIGFTLDEVEIIRQEVLHKANYYRSMFGIRELYLEKNLNQYSQNWANQLALKANHLSLNSTLEKSSPPLYGEILFTSYPVKYVGEVAVDFCFYEVVDVDRIHERNVYYVSHNEKTKKLNQLLWMASFDIGVGAAIGTDGKYIVVMNFNSIGNVSDFMIENVPKFTDELMKEARKKLDVINEKRSELLKDLNIRIPILPGWHTMLYDSEFDPNDTSKYKDKPKK